MEENDKYKNGIEDVYNVAIEVFNKHKDIYLYDLKKSNKQEDKIKYTEIDTIQRTVSFIIHPLFKLLSDLDSQKILDIKRFNNINKESLRINFFSNNCKCNECDSQINRFEFKLVQNAMQDELKVVQNAMENQINIISQQKYDIWALKKQVENIQDNLNKANSFFLFLSTVSAITCCVIFFLLSRL